VSGADLVPTILDAAGIAAPESPSLEGVSFMPLLEGSMEPRPHALFWHFPGYLNKPFPGSRDAQFRTRPVSVIRRGRWKLLLYHEEWVLDRKADEWCPGYGVELYDLEVDPGETRNLAPEETAICEELSTELLEWLSDRGASLAHEANPDYRPSGASDGDDRRRDWPGEETADD
jgi:arylsulfatase A-like enzyme